MARSSTTSTEFDWLYPELLTKDGLITILKQRYIQESNLEELDKEELLQLYYKYILPLPQRQYRKNRRGREMTRKQILMAKKRRIEAPDDGNTPKKKKKIDPSNDDSSRFVTSFNDPSKAGDRLKPPPTCIDPNRKTIKLGSVNKSPVSPTTKQDISSLSKKIVKITMSPESPEKKVTGSNTIKQINKHIESNEENSKKEENGHVEMKSDDDKNRRESTDSESGETKPQKKKLKRISWP